jgi:hypothetical protein
MNESRPTIEALAGRTSYIPTDIQPEYQNHCLIFGGNKQVLGKASRLLSFDTTRTV